MDDGTRGAVAELPAPMLKKTLFVAINHTAGSQIEPFVADHLAYMNAPEAGIRIWASGPFIQEGVLVGDSVTILSTATIEDLADFYHDGSRLFGVDTLKRDLTVSAEVLEALTPGFVAGDYRGAPIAETCGLGEGQDAYRKVAAGAAGRIVLRQQE